MKPKKYDQKKPRMDLLPMDAMEGIADVLTYGATKYGANSWQRIPDGAARYRAALLRHMAAQDRGERVDLESGLSHAAHIACNAMFMLWVEHHHIPLKFCSGMPTIRSGDDNVQENGDDQEPIVQFGPGFGHHGRTKKDGARRAHDTTKHRSCDLQLDGGEKAHQRGESK
jgi:hypothetical protein